MEINILKHASDRSGLACFCMVRNEGYLLPHFLAHHRLLGVRHFILYDDHSDDGSTEFMLAQDDCTVVTSGLRFQEAMEDGRPFHYHARSAIPEHLVRDDWCLTVDVDEFLLLPTGFSDVPQLTEELDRRGHACVLAPMVDLYPRTLRGRSFDRSLPPFAGCNWWFDAAPGFMRDIDTGQIHGSPAGIRVRLLQKLLGHEGGGVRSTEAQALLPEGSIYYSKLWKVPLVRTGLGIVRLDSHSVTIAPPEDLQVALAHFKFTPATDQKVREALELRNYYGASIDYVFLAEAIKHLEDEDLVGPTSVRFRSHRSLEEAGLIFAARAPGTAR